MQESFNKRRIPRVGFGKFSLSPGRAVIRSFQRMLKDLQFGTIDLIWPDGTCTTHGTEASGDTARVTVTLHNYIPVRRLIIEGHNGFVEAYLDGHWSTNDLRTMFEIVMRNETMFESVLEGKLLARIRNAIMHMFNRNSHAGSRRNISYHYDLGNEFYSVWLDDSMTYSSALFSNERQSLADAQANKIERIAQLLAPSSDSKVLEIGCGWGALGKALVEKTACQVQGVSLSQEQLDYANSENADPRVSFEFKDYRDLAGQYDHIVSIEMFEAVGRAYWQTYFSQLKKLLTANGTALLQIITIEESRFETYSKQPDFIQGYVFPGGMLPTRNILYQLIDDAGFEVTHAQWFGDSYARTLRIWRDNFERQLDRIRALGYDERFIRLWRYYLTYCETGFSRATTDVCMLHISRKTGDPVS